MTSPLEQDNVDTPRFSYIEHCTTGLSAYQSIKQRTLKGNIVFGRKVRVSAQPLLSLFTNPPNKVFEFINPSNELCIPSHCDYAHAIHNGYFLAVGDEVGRLILLQTDRNNNTQNDEVHTSFPCHSSIITNVKWSNDDSMILTGGNDAMIKLWDAETRTQLATFEGHGDTVKAVNWHSVDEHAFISSSNDGSFKIWDTRLNQVPADDPEDITRIPLYHNTKSVDNAHQTAPKRTRKAANPRVARSVTSALFFGSNETQVISSGSDDGRIKLWDIRAGRAARMITSTLFESPTGRKKGIADLKLDHTGTRLFSACLDNTIYMHYLSDLSRPARRYTDPELRLNSFDTRVSISPDDKFLLSGSENGDMYIWTVDGSRTKANIYKAHAAKSTSLAWCRSQYYQFASCSDDYTTRIWGVDFNASSSS